MFTKLIIRSFLICALVVTGLPVIAGGRDASLAEVHVYKENLADKTRYIYVVTNNGSSPITSIEIGFNYYLGEAEFQGANPQRIIAPQGWESRITNVEESDLYSIAWETAVAPIQPGQMRTGFIVETSAEQSQFLNSHWTVTIDGPIFAASDSLVHINGPAPVDTLPPIIHATADPARLWPPNGALKKITVSVVATDDTDASPMVKLLSVSCAECKPGDISGAEIGTDDREFFVRARRQGKNKMGRVYTATYQATDAAGNSATTTAEVVVPHDSRK